MSEQLERYTWLIGLEAINKLQAAHVAVIGVGGVGGAAVHALARAGVGTISVYDHDKIEKSNINRQIVANQTSIGRLKVDVLKAQIKEINEDIQVNAFPLFVDEQNLDSLPWEKFDFLIDAIDNIKSKLLIIEKSKRENVPIISAMGAGNRLDPSQLYGSDIFKTINDPFAKIIRTELRKQGIQELKVVASYEKPIKPNNEGQKAPGSSPFVPNAMGLLMASYVAKTLTETGEHYEIDWNTSNNN